MKAAPLDQRQHRARSAYLVVREEVEHRDARLAILLEAPACMQGMHVSTGTGRGELVQKR